VFNSCNTLRRVTVSNSRIALAGVIVGVVAILALVTVVSAQEIGQASTSIQVQNLSTEAEANVVIVYYNQDGTVRHSEGLTIPPGGSANRDTRADYSDAEIPSGWRGSVVLYSDQPIVAISNQYTGIWQAPYGSSGSYSEGASTVRLPLIMCNWYGWNTNFHVQNAGTSATTVGVEYVPALAGVTYSNTVDVGPGASQSVNQGAMCGTIGSMVGGQIRFNGSVVLSSSEPIVAVVNEENVAQQMKYTYDGFVGAGDTVHAPLVLSRHYDNYTSLQIQNSSLSMTANVTITYQADDVYTLPDGLKGSTLVVTGSVAPKTTWVRYERDATAECLAGNPTALDDLCQYERFVGTAQIVSDQPVMVVTNVQNDVSGRAASYDGISASDASKEALAPLVMFANYGWLTSLHVMNIGDDPTQVTIVYTPDSAFSIPATGVVTKTFTIQPGELLLRYEQSGHAQSDLDGLFTRFVGSARITSDTENIALIVDEDKPGTGGDWMMSYNGFYQAPSP
jgi:hypothetical protein